MIPFLGFITRQSGVSRERRRVAHVGSPGRADSHVPHVSGRRVAHVTFVAFPTVFPTRSRGDQPPRSRRSRGLWSAFHVSDVRHQKGGSPGGALASLPTPAHVDHLDHLGGWPPSRLARLAPLTWITWITWAAPPPRLAWLAPLTWITWITWLQIPRAPGSAKPRIVWRTWSAWARPSSAASNGKTTLHPSLRLAENVARVYVSGILEAPTVYFDSHRALGQASPKSQLPSPRRHGALCRALLPT